MVKHIPDGQDFSFPKDFGFSGSAGPLHSVSGPGGPKPYAKGGAHGAHKPTKAVVAVVTPHEPPQPTHDPQNAIRAAAAIGALMGAKAARSGHMAPPRFAEGGMAMDEDRPVPPSKLVPTPRPNPMRDPADSPNWEDETISRDGMTHNVQFLKGTSTWRERPTDEGDTKPAHKSKGGKFIKGAIRHPGQLHRDLGVPQGEPIPAAKLEAAAHKPGKVGQRARFAETLKKMPRHHGPRKG